MNLIIFKLFQIFCLLQAFESAKKQRSEFPSFVETCSRHDPELNDCVKNTLESLKDRLGDGIPEIFIPPMEPLVIPEVKLNQDSGAIYLHSTYKNIKVHGLSDFSVDAIKMDPKKVRFTMVLTFPKVKLEADYTIKGKIMMMPLIGDGRCKANFTNVELTTKINGQLVKRQGKSFVKVKEIKVDYKLGKAKLNFENLFNGDSALGKRMNRFLNENWSSLSDEIQPLMQNAITEIIKSSTDQIFGTYTFDQILPE